MGKRQFKGVVQGEGFETSRLGNKTSGLLTQAAGWKGMIEVRLTHDKETDRDEFVVYMYPHWNHRGTGEVIARGILDVDALKDPFVPAMIM